MCVRDREGEIKNKNIKKKRRSTNGEGSLLLWSSNFRFFFYLFLSIVSGRPNEIAKRCAQGSGPSQLPWPSTPPFSSFAWRPFTNDLQCRSGLDSSHICQVKMLEITPIGCHVLGKQRAMTTQRNERLIAIQRRLGTQPIVVLLVEEPGSAHGFGTLKKRKKKQDAPMARRKKGVEKGHVYFSEVH